ncbi:hypothetical protein [Streptomyces sp. 7-21]|uniref:hypothetical protein n=1 Tax=Streptomyces sp. 7-21 TaxID=2802283 RepID=UPI00191F9671|nr:hypothetical protein [Streptomyces sp. 7-21]MBL1066107.1 hypothetical protein [Streptomyces sp. 7-21]
MRAVLDTLRVVERDDIRPAPEPRQGARLGQRPLELGGVAGVLAAGTLEDDVLVEQNVAGVPHLARAAAAEEFQQPVAARDLVLSTHDAPLAR